MKQNITSGPVGWRRYSKEVTTPKLPPPPLMPQKRSAFSVSLAVRNLPSALTRSTDTRLSEDSPYLRLSQPIPPPKVSPADRKSTRLNSSHANISYAVFC